jgi:hypothetical protein
VRLVGVRRVSRADRIGRVGRVSRVSSFSRVSWVGRVGRVSRVGRVGKGDLFRRVFSDLWMPREIFILSASTPSKKPLLT